MLPNLPVQPWELDYSNNMDAARDALKSAAFWIGLIASILTILGFIGVIKTVDITIPKISNPFGNCDAKITLDKQRLPSGEPLIVSGTGFPKNEEITISEGAEFLITIKSDNGGDFTQEVRSHDFIASIPNGQGPSTFPGIIIAEVEDDAFCSDSVNYTTTQ